MLFAALGACGGNSRTVFPRGLEPLEENTASPPTPTAGDPRPEVLSVVSGKAPDWAWTHGRAYVHAPLAAVWRVLRDPAATHDPTIPDWTVDWNVEPYPVSYVIHYTVHQFLTVRFDVTWRFGVVEGNDAAPAVVAGRFQKTWGTTFIRLMEGSLVARKAEGAADATELELIEHLDATNTGTADTESYLADYYRQILAGVH